MNANIKTKILIGIYSCYQYPLNEVTEVFDACKSFDSTILILEMAQQNQTMPIIIAKSFSVIGKTGKTWIKLYTGGIEACKVIEKQYKYAYKQIKTIHAYNLPSYDITTI
jgi:hypothetical protein